MKTPDRTAFTLLELLAAAAITVLLVGLVLMVATRALDLWHRGQGEFGVLAGAGGALDLLERDLHAATRGSGDTTWLRVALAKEERDLANRGWLLDGIRRKPGGVPSFQPLPVGDSIGNPMLADARFGLAGAWLKLVATTAESGSEAALPRIVAWQIARRPLTGAVSAGNPAPRRYLLFRSALTAADTLALGADVTAPALASRSESPAGTRAASTMMNPAAADVVAANVIDFGLWLYAADRDGGLRRIFPIDGGDREFSAGALDEVAPVAADVLVRVLTEEGARRVELIESGHLIRPGEYATDAAWWWAIADEHSRVLVRRIQLKGGPR
jgi:hypothetical protein